MEKFLKIIKNKRIIPIIALMLATIVSLSITITFAAYTHSHSAQRTLGAYEDAGELFSSNYLSNVEFARDNVRTITVGTSETEPTSSITICNYSQNNPGRWFTSTLSYQLTAKFVKQRNGDFVDIVNAEEEVGNYSITVNDVTLTKNKTSHTFASSFDGTVADIDSYIVTFKISGGTNFIEDKPNLYLAMTATPANGLGLSPLQGILQASLRNVEPETGWTGSFSDNDTIGISNYNGGFNYTVKGLGVGACKLEWNSSKLNISPQSLYLLTGYRDETGVVINGANKYVVFNVNSNVVSSYELQFYKGSAYSDSETWSSLKSYVTLIYPYSA